MYISIHQVTYIFWRFSCRKVFVLKCWFFTLRPFLLTMCLFDGLKIDRETVLFLSTKPSRSFTSPAYSTDTRDLDFQYHQTVWVTNTESQMGFYLFLTCNMSAGICMKHTHVRPRDGGGKLWIIEELPSQIMEDTLIVKHLL